MLCFLNGIFGLARIFALFPVFIDGKTGSIRAFSVYFTIESFCFYLAIWLFGIKYYETALDIEHMLSKDSQQR